MTTESDKLAKLMIDDIESAVSTTVTDTKPINAISLAITDYLKSINIAPSGEFVSYGYVDTISQQASGTAFNLAATFTNDATASLKEYVDSRDTEILLEAKEYTDNSSASIIGVLGEDASVGKAVYQSENGYWYLAKAVAGMASSLCIVKVGGVAGGEVVLTRFGKITGLSGLPTSKEVYLSQDVAGELTDSVYTEGVVIYVGITQGTTILNVTIGVIGRVLSKTYQSILENQIFS